MKFTVWNFKYYNNCTALKLMTKKVENYTVHTVHISQQHPKMQHSLGLVSSEVDWCKERDFLSLRPTLLSSDLGSMSCQDFPFSSGQCNLLFDCTFKVSWKQTDRRGNMTRSLTTGFRLVELKKNQNMFDVTSDDNQSVSYPLCVGRFLSNCCSLVVRWMWFYTGGWNRF